MDVGELIDKLGKFPRDMKLGMRAYSILLHYSHIREADCSPHVEKVKLVRVSQNPFFRGVDILLKSEDGDRQMLVID